MLKLNHPFSNVTILSDPVNNEHIIPTIAPDKINAFIKYFMMVSPASLFDLNTGLSHAFFKDALIMNTINETRRIMPNLIQKLKKFCELAYHAKGTLFIINTTAMT